MSKKSKLKIAVSLYIFIFACLYSYSQDKDTRYLKGFCQVSKTKYHYTAIWALNMKYRFVVCDGKRTVLDKISDSWTSFTPQGGSGGSGGLLKKTGDYDFNLVIIEQDDDKGIFVFDIMMRYKGKFYQAKLKKLVSFDGKKTEIVSFNMNDYVKDPKLLKKLDEYYTERDNRHRKRNKNPKPIDHKDIVKEINARARTVKAKSKAELRKENRAPQFKKDSLEKYWSDEKKGLNIKDSTNVERIKLGLQPIRFLLRKPIAWKVNPKRKPKQSQALK